VSTVCRTCGAVLYRAGAPGLLTPGGCQQFGDLGLHSVVDLREQAEIDSLPNPPSSAQVHQMPLYHSRIALENVEDLASAYRDTVPPLQCRQGPNRDRHCDHLIGVGTR
jgi:hypothetical protein